MHVNIVADNWDQMIDFYENKLGLKKKIEVKYKEYLSRPDRPEQQKIAQTDPERVMYAYFEIVPGQFIELFPNTDLPHDVEWYKRTGLNHFSLTVDDIHEPMMSLKRQVFILLVNRLRVHQKLGNSGQKIRMAITLKFTNLLIIKEFRIERLILKMGNSINYIRTLDLKDTNITPTQSETILYYSSHPGRNIKDLAQYLNVTHQATLKLVDKLKAKGILNLTVSSEDRRFTSIFLTAEGEKLSKTLKGNGFSVGQRILTDFSEQEKLLGYLLRIKRNIDKEENKD